MAPSTAKYRILGVEHAGLLKSNGEATPALVEHDLHFINNVTFDVQQQDVAFEGDNQTVRIFFLNGIVATVVCDTYDLGAISSAFGKDEIATGLPTGVTGRVYFGDSIETAGVKVGFVAQVLATNLTTQLVETLRIVLPVTTLTVVRPPTLAFNSKGVLNITLTAEKSTVDMLGADLPGVPAEGAFWYLDRIAA